MISSRNNFLYVWLIGFTLHTPAFSASDEVVRLNNDAMAELNQKSYQSAINKLQTAMSKDPTFIRARTNLAHAFMCQGLASSEPASALISLHNAAYFDPDNSEIELCLDQCIQRLKLDPNSFEDRLKLARAAESAQDNISALIEYRAAYKIKADPSIKERMSSFHLKNYSKWDTEKLDEVCDAVAKQLIVGWKSPSPMGNETVCVSFVLNENNTVSQITVEKGSENSEIDRSCVHAVEALKLTWTKESEGTVYYCIFRNKLSDGQSFVFYKPSWNSFISEMRMRTRGHWIDLRGKNDPFDSKKVSLELKIDRFGKIVSLSIAKSSGEAKFDNASLQALRMAVEDAGDFSPKSATTSTRFLFSIETSIAGTEIKGKVLEQ